jgi:hypothetical protein
LSQQQNEGVAEDQVCGTGGDFPRRNGGEIIGSANFVLPIAALIDASILVERFDSDTDGGQRGVESVEITRTL